MKKKYGAKTIIVKVFFKNDSKFTAQIADVVEHVKLLQFTNIDTNTLCRLLQITGHITSKTELLKVS